MSKNILIWIDFYYICLSCRYHKTIYIFSITNLYFSLKYIHLLSTYMALKKTKSYCDLQFWDSYVSFPKLSTFSMQNNLKYNSNDVNNLHLNHVNNYININTSMVYSNSFLTLSYPVISVGHFLMYRNILFTRIKFCRI